MPGLPFGVQNDISVVICDGADDAIAKGYKYNKPEYVPVEIQKAVIVRKGTLLGNSTVDLILVDEEGNKHVVMLTSGIVRGLADAL